MRIHKLTATRDFDSSLLVIIRNPDVHMDDDGVNPELVCYPRKVRLSPRNIYIDLESE
jgi:hypothetical protein